MTWPFLPIFILEKEISMEGTGDWDRSNYWYRKSMGSSEDANTNRLWYSGFVWLSNNLALSEKYKEALDLIDSITPKFSTVESAGKNVFGPGQGP